MLANFSFTHSSILHVMNSLTPNGRRVFLLLANHQLDQGDNSSYIGMSFQLLYQLCREAFLVNSDLTLQAQLVEFRDHRLIRSKKVKSHASFVISSYDCYLLLKALHIKEAQGDR